MAKKKHKKQEDYYPQRKMTVDVNRNNWNPTIHTERNPFAVRRESPMFKTNTMSMPTNTFLSRLEQGARVNPFGGSRETFLSKAKHKKHKLSPFGDGDKKISQSLLGFKSKPGKHKPKHKVKGKYNHWYIGDGYAPNAYSQQELRKAEKQLKEQKIKKELRKLHGESGEESLQRPQTQLEKARVIAENAKRRFEKSQEQYNKDLLAERYGENAAQTLIDNPNASEYSRLALAKDTRARERAEADAERLLKREQRYEKIRDTGAYKAADKYEQAKKRFLEHDLTKGAKKMITQRYSAKAQRAASRAKTATFGILGALTETGGIGDGRSAIAVGKRGGLSGYKTTGSRKGAGRPKGTYKYGLPVKELQKMQREQKRQFELQKLVAEQRAMETQAQREIQQAARVGPVGGQMSLMPPVEPRPMMVPQAQQQMPMMMPQQQETLLSDDDMQADFKGAMNAGFVTDDLVNGINAPPQQPMNPYAQQQMYQAQAPQGERNLFLSQAPVQMDYSRAMTVPEQAAAAFNARQSPQSVPGILVPDQSKLGQPNRPNPFGTRAKKWRPNFSMNVFKTNTTQPLKFQNTILKPVRRASTEPVVRQPSTSVLSNNNPIIVPAWKQQEDQMKKNERIRNVQGPTTYNYETTSTRQDGRPNARLPGDM